MESSSFSIEELLAEALSLAQSSQYQSAAVTYSRILKQMPRQPQANYGLGMLAVRHQDYSNALRYLKTALEASPATADHWIAYIEALHKSGDTDSAIKVLQQGISKGLVGDEVDALSNMLTQPRGASLYSKSLEPALRLRESGQYGAAIDWINEWTRANPTDANAYSLLAHLFLLLRQTQFARQAIDKARGIDQVHAAVSLNHARVQLVEGQPALAKQYLEPVRVAFSEDAEVRLLQASIENALGNIDHASTIVESVINSRLCLAEAHSIRALLFVRKNRLEAAITDCQFALSVKPFLSQTSFIYASLLIKQGNLNDALTVLDKALEYDPDNIELLATQGECNREMANFDAALHQLEKATSLNSSHAIAWANYGTALQQTGQTAAAKRALSKAYDLNPRLAVVVNNLALLAMHDGNYLQALTYLDESLQLAPSNTDLLVNKCMVLMGLGQIEAAINLSLQALEQEQNFRTQQNFCSILQEVPTFHLSERLCDKLILALKEGWTRPAQLSRLVSRHMACHTLISSTVSVRTIHDFASALRSVPPEALSSFFEHRLFQTLLSTTPVVEADIEIFLTRLRRLLLYKVSGDKASLIQLECLPESFLSALAQQCFVNDYAFTCDNGEYSLVDQLTGRFDQPYSLFVFAMYKPLFLSGLTESVIRKNVTPELFHQQYIAPLSEQKYRNFISAIGSVQDEVSLKVQNQYEENPYPKWVVAAQVNAAQGIDSYISSILPNAPYVALRTASPSILIAGCGTGQQSIQTAMLFPQSRIVAIDLSLASLAYAMRKTKELGINNIEYIQADILELNELDHTFDVIQSTGVLHHLADPEIGWDVLTSMLVPRGLMKIALYSRSGRADLRKVHEFIKESALGNGASEIRQFRSRILSRELAQFDTLLSKGDFYNLSNCRDLLFHVQEEQFTLPRIKSYLVANNLQLLGFQLPNKVMRKYSLNFADDPSATNLDNWHRFELDNPQTFSGMYQFWIQKKAD